MTDASGSRLERPRPAPAAYAALRRLVAETRLAPADLVLPLFVKEGLAEAVPVSAMPGSSSTPATRCARPPTRRSRRASVG